jgi:hypothetical protein
MFEQIRRAFVLIWFHRTLVSLDFVKFPYERFEGVREYTATLFFKVGTTK